MPYPIKQGWNREKYTHIPFSLSLCILHTLESLYEIHAHLLTHTHIHTQTPTHTHTHTHTHPGYNTHSNTLNVCTVEIVLRLFHLCSTQQHTDHIPTHTHTQTTRT